MYDALSLVRTYSHGRLTASQPLTTNKQHVNLAYSWIEFQFTLVFQELANQNDVRF